MRLDQIEIESQSGLKTYDYIPITPESLDRVKGLDKGASKVGEVKNPKPTQVSVDEKLNDYLLNPDYPVGGSKAKWFDEALGYNKSNIEDFSKQIVFDSKKAVQTSVTEHGVKYNQIISIKGANGNVIDIKFAWIKNNDGIIRLITSIPTKK